MITKELLRCPVCKGKGKIPKPFHMTDERGMRKTAVIALYKAGYSIRQIQKFVGYKSPRSVGEIVERLGQLNQNKHEGQNR